MTSCGGCGRLHAIPTTWNFVTIVTSVVRTRFYQRSRRTPALGAAGWEARRTPALGAAGWEGAEGTDDKVTTSQARIESE